MKVFVLGTRGFPNVQGGVEKHCQELYPRLVKLGYAVTVFTRASYIPRDKRIDEWKGVNFIHLHFPKSKFFEAIIHTFFSLLIAVIKRPDILHIHAIGPSIFTPLAKLFRLKVVITHHGFDYRRQKWGGLAKCVLKLGESLGIKFADKIIIISKTTKILLENKYKRKDLEFIPNGVELLVYVPAGETLSRYGLKPRGYVFAVCRFVPEKGLHDLIEAYRRIKNLELKLVIAGDADHLTAYSQRLKKQAQEIGVILTGFVSGKPLEELYSNAGLFVLPSYHEGVSIGLLEALSYGLPVLVSNIPQNKEVPLAEYRYFDVGDVGELARKIEDLVEEGISREEKNRQLEFLKKEYDWDKVARKTAEAYTTL